MKLERSLAHKFIYWLWLLCISTIAELNCDRKFSCYDKNYIAHKSKIFTTWNFIETTKSPSFNGNTQWPSLLNVDDFNLWDKYLSKGFIVFSQSNILSKRESVWKITCLQTYNLSSIELLTGISWINYN